jgi:aminoglycoside phosphotransferase (APT) family kinase protein
VDVPLFPDDVRQLLDGQTSATVLFPLSESVRGLIESDENESSLARSIRKLVEQSEVVWKPKIGRHKIVLKCSPGIALKIILQMDNLTEYTMLQYLEEHKPTIPAPRPLGLVRVGDCFLVFMSLVPGTTLEAVWPKLDDSLKRSVQEQLNDIFIELRSLTRPDNMPLGGVAGEGCQDLRRYVRRTTDPIWTTEDFDNWQFSNPRFGSPIYIKVLRSLCPPLSQKHVLSHNDLRPENIMVELGGGQCRMTGIIDWQYGGFYPEYFESTKVMNGLSTNEDNDWYLFIPECISPLRNTEKWLLDALWWKHVE